MSVEENKAVVRRAFERLSQGDMTVFDEHPGLVEVRGTAERLHVAMPDTTMRVELQFGEGDWVAMRLTLTGTNTGPGLVPGLAATGKRVTCEELVLVQVQNGTIVKQHSQADVAGIMQQLGLMPGVGQVSQ